MPSKTINADQQISEYLENTEPFAKAICNRLRKIIFDAVPV
jgi:hypothetical protein